MKRFAHREVKSMIERFEQLKQFEKDFHLRAHYDEILYHLRCAKCFAYGGSYYSVKDQMKKGWL